MEDQDQLPVKQSRVGRPPKHGIYRPDALVPLTEEKSLYILSILYGDASLVRNQDKIAVELLARNLAKIELMDLYLQEHGLFLDEQKGTLQPILKVYWTALAAATRQCDSLGLTPAARARLGLRVAQVEDLAGQIARRDDDA